MGVKESEKLSGVPKSVLKFTNDLGKIFAKSMENSYLCSGLSAHVVLSMAAHGADKNTAVEMRKVLHISDGGSELLQDYQQLIDLLNTNENAVRDQILVASNEREISEILEYKDITEEERSKLIENRRAWYEEKKLTNKKLECIATLANRIYISNHIEVQEHYDNALSTYFRSKSETLDFLNNRHESGKIINDWCFEATNGKITNIANPASFTEDTALILINAVYFKGTWQNKFQSATPKDFHLSMFKKIKVPTMYIESKGVVGYRNLRKLNAESVKLSFKDSKKYMEIIIPNKISGLKFIEKNLDKISGKEFEPKNVRLWLPKFEVQSEIQFEEHLIQMGMREAFDEKLANFNKISDKELFIKKVLQKAYIKVDELGCEATVATQATMDTKKCLRYSSRKPSYITIKADRPFLFRIMDSRLNIPLFSGTVMNPINE